MNKFLEADKIFSQALARQRMPGDASASRLIVDAAVDLLRNTVCADFDICEASKRLADIHRMISIVVPPLQSFLGGSSERCAFITRTDITELTSVVRDILDSEPVFMFFLIIIFIANIHALFSFRFLAETHEPHPKSMGYWQKSFCAHLQQSRG